ncbi:MAG: hypothetical protein MK320_11925 [Gammaproteobacteria bacterium]|nr:hypothetical protein [Gammaproteobacteria bacterium]
MKNSILRRDSKYLVFVHLSVSPERWLDAEPRTPNPESLVASACFSNDCVGVGCFTASMASALVIEVSQRLVYTIGPPLITRRSGLLRTVVR